MVVKMTKTHQLLELRFFDGRVSMPTDRVPAPLRKDCQADPTNEDHVLVDFPIAKSIIDSEIKRSVRE